MTKFTKQIVTVGSSSGVIVDKKILKKLKLKKGDWVEIDVKKLKI